MNSQIVKLEKTHAAIDAIWKMAVDMGHAAESNGPAHLAASPAHVQRF